MINSIRKGKRYEREIANYLTKKTGLKWQRTPQSGATATSQNLKETFKGDVFTEQEPYHSIVIECKNMAGKDISLAHLFRKKSKIHSFIQQAEKEAGNNNWLLFIRFKGKDFITFSKEAEKTTKQLALKLIDKDKGILIFKGDKTYYIARATK